MPLKKTPTSHQRLPPPLRPMSPQLLNQKLKAAPRNLSRNHKKRKRAAGHNEEAEDVGFENSGDEEIVERGLKRQRKKGRKGLEDEDEGW